MNRLSESSSPYLQQHANQPVHWYPWGEEALNKAREENKLIIISIGYSTCHWCHVMAHEVFDDDSVAAFMNEHFISIKVDREERPDIDQVYMRAVQMMTGQGGWPLNCVALPDGRPVWGGTYFPKDRWVASLRKILDVRKEDPEAVEDYAEKLEEGIRISGTLAPVQDPAPLDEDLFHAMRHNWSRRWDSVEGGPNKAPKFPLPGNYLYLLRYASQFDDAKALNHVRLTLNAMYRGGLYDHVGGGFTRYSTDAQWRIPHFEKMLYDNGQLLELYAEAYKVWKDPAYERVLRRTTDFLMRELRAENGLFYSALDADSEGEEGRFYVWTSEEVDLILKEEAGHFKEVADWNGRGYWEDGKHVVLISPEATIPDAWNKWMELLSSERSKRIRPSTDTKFLSAWNAIAISGIAKAASALSDREIMQLAVEAGEEFFRQFYHDEILWHALGERGTYIEGFSDDYALAARCCIDLHAVTADPVWLERAYEITQRSLDLFGSEDSPLLWYAGKDQETLISKTQETQDNVIPSANSVAARNLFRLGRALGKPEWEDRSLTMVQMILEDAATYPESYTEWLQSALDIRGPFREVSVVGPEAPELLSGLCSKYIPNAILMGTTHPSELPPFESRHTGEITRIFVCEERRCELPVGSIEEALTLIPVEEP